MSDEKTDQLVTRWRMARDRVEEARNGLSDRESELRKITEELAKWLTPADAKPEEKFSVWVEGRLLEVTCDRARGITAVKERPGGKHG